uniref:Uncharacterized protein n=1 Tax=Arundo donax TaxID=35708 RepID=A0A0A9GSQ0_ARUDO
MFCDKTSKGTIQSSDLAGAAIEGDEMVSIDEKDEPFVLGNNQCWVLEDNRPSMPKTARDSRFFGSVLLSIFGRVIYSLRTSVDHALVRTDSPILAMELDLEALVNGANMHLRK